MQHNNRYELLRLLRNETDHSKASLARAIDVSPSTVNSLADTLIDEGLIALTGEKQKRSRGRRGEVIDLNPHHRSSIGLEITDLDVTGVLIDFTGTVHETHSELLTSTHHEDVIKATTLIIEKLLLATDHLGPLDGIGIAAHGNVDPKEGQLVRFPGNPQWQPLPLAKVITERYNTRAELTFRIIAATKGEVLHNDWSSVPGPIVYFNSGPGNGFGVGVVDRGSVLTGQSGFAGQLGHFCIRPGGKRCFCGSHGCLVTVASISAVIERVRTALDRGVESTLQGLKNISFDDIVEHATQSDKLAHSVIQDLGTDLGLGFSYVLNLLNPSHVIVGGTMARGGLHLLDAMTRSAQMYSTSPIFSNVSWHLSNLTWNAAALGAAQMMFDPYFGSMN